MAEATEGSIEIDAPPADVLRVIANFAAYPEWAEGVREAEVLETDGWGRGVRVAMHVSSGFVDARYTLAYRYEEADAGLTWSTVEASGALRSLEGEYALALSGSVTRVTYRLTIEPAIALPGFLRRSAEKTIVGTALDGLKKRVEAGR